MKTSINVIKHWTLGTLMLATLFSSPSTYAQSADNCMNAEGEDAVSICQQVLERGNSGPEVYYQLSAQLYQLGRTDEALSVLNKGLSTHKNNSLLTTLRKTLTIDSAEQAALRASAQKNDAVMNRGQLKITCLTRATRAGLNACEAYLAQTNVDGDRIRARASEIKSSLSISTPTQSDSPTVVAQRPETDTYTTPQVPQRPVPIPQVIPNEPTTPAKPDAAQLAMRELIWNVQSGLSSMGFDVGIPDGISGPKTRTAIREFYQLTRKTNSERLDDQTLIDVQDAKARLEDAQRLLARSRNAASSQNFDEARLLLGRAEDTSPLFTAPAGYLQTLELQIARADNKQPDASVPTTTTPSTETTTNTELLQLKSQIASITAALDVQRTSRKRQSDAMRDEVDVLFR